MSLCPCGSGRPYEECCETYIEGRETAPTAEALMRSRYAAHTLGKYDYLNETVHPSIRDEADHEDMKKWSEAVGGGKDPCKFLPPRTAPKPTRPVKYP
mgnify:CR=1 FL=1